MASGGIALNLYGIKRVTVDIDIVLKLDEEVEMPFNFDGVYKNGRMKNRFSNKAEEGL